MSVCPTGHPTESRCRSRRSARCVPIAREWSASALRRRPSGRSCTCRSTGWRPVRSRLLSTPRDLGLDERWFARPEHVTFPTGRRSDGTCTRLPTDQPRPHRSARRAPAADREDPWGAHGGGSPDPAAVDSSTGRAGASASPTSTTAARPVTAGPYRDLLQGQWGIADVEDCVAVAAHLAARPDGDPLAVDGERLAITGGSAGGYTTLAALAFHDGFSAGASHFGIADLEALRSRPTSSSRATSTVSSAPIPRHVRSTSIARPSITSMGSTSRLPSSRAWRTRSCRPSSQR